MDLKWKLSANYEDKEMGHFARECRASTNKEGHFRNQDNTRKQGNNEDTSSKAMLAIDGVGFDWSDTCDDLIVKLNQTKFTTSTYKRVLATIEEQLVTYRNNEVLFSEEVIVLKREVACKDYEISVLKTEFEKVKQEKESIEFKIEKFNNASKSLDKLLGSQITDRSKNGLGYNVVPPPHPLIYNGPTKIDLSYSGLDEFKEPKFKSYGSKDKQVSKDTSSFVESPINVDKETIFLVDKKIEFVKPKNHEKPVKKSVRNVTRNIAYLLDFKEFDGCYVTFGRGVHSGRISGKGTLKTDSLDFEDILLKIPRKDNMHSFDMKNIVPKESLTCLVAKATLDESMLWHSGLGCNTELLISPRFTWVFFLTTKDETSEILKNFIKEIENLMDKKVKIIRSDNGTEFKNKNGMAERRNQTLIEAARTMLANYKLPTTFWIEAVSTACYVHNMVLVVKPHNKTPYELFRGFKPALSFIRPFGCHVTILNTLDSLGKFDGKSDEGFFVGYSLSSKAFKVYNTRTMRVEENLHIGFLENKPMIEGNGPKWLFDINSITQSINYVLVAAGTIINESADASYFDSPSKDVDNGEPKSAVDDQRQIKDGPDDENDEKDKYEDDSSPKEINTTGQHVNTASPKVNTGHFKLNIVGPSVNTASLYDQDSTKDMFTMGASQTLKATHVEFFSYEDEPKVDLRNITNSYTVPTTPNIRIHKDHPSENVIGDVKSSVQTRRMTKPTSEQGFLSAVYEQKTYDTLNTYLYACSYHRLNPQTFKLQ
ncbi:putative ribonuclease H-like domain-containing protein [Tanacetum coccineum]